jgi:hypothetical protein
MKLRLLPIFITIIVTSAVLFGGWSVYQTVAMEDPLSNHVAAVGGVDQVHIELSRSSANIEVTLKPNADLREVYQGVTKASEAVLGGREFTVEVKDEPSKDLDAIWSTALFDVAQAMETKQYSLIPNCLEQLEKENQGLTASTRMDDVNVYITLADGNAEKHIVLPRTPAQMGVWPNE